MRKTLLIVGIDPGTTTAYALFNPDGELVESHAAKNKPLGYLISRVIEKGVPVITATDVAFTPHFVQKFHRKMGTQLMHPDVNLLVQEKRELVRGLALPTQHEQDAASAAIYAYRKIEPLLRRIEEYVDQKNRSDLE